MKNPLLRWITIILGGAIALALIGAGVLFFLLSRIDARAVVEREVEAATGRDLTIAGDVGISFYPVIGLTAHEASLANIEGARAPAFVRMRALGVALEIMPLFKREIRVRGLVLDAPQIALELDEKGAPNWILKPRVRVPAAPAPTTGAQAPAPAPFSMGDVRVIKGEVSFYDGKSKTGWIVADADLSTALTSLDAPMRVTGDIAYNGADIGVDLTIDKPRAAFEGKPTGLQISLSSELLTARFVGQTAPASAALSGDVRASGPDLKALAAWAGAPLTGVAGFGGFAVQGQLALEGPRLAFSNAALVIDRVRGRGDFVVLQNRARPYVSGRLELFDLDLNPYLTGAGPVALESGADAALDAIAAGQIAEVAEAASAPAPRALDIEQAPAQTPVDFSGLKAFDADLELVTGTLRAQAMSIDRARVTLVLNDGFLAATLHELALYGGSGRGRLTIDARGAEIAIEEDLAISRANARALLSDGANYDNLEGTADLTFGLRARGRTQSEFVRSIDGRAHIEVVNGALRGVDLGGVSRTISNAVRGELIGADKRTAFNGFSADFSIADGVLASDSLSFNTPDLRITGLGVIDFAARRADFRFAPRSPRGGLVFPFAVSGTVNGELAYTSDIRGRALRDLTGRVEAVKRGARER